MDSKNNIRKPPWLKVRANFGSVYTEVRGILKELNLHTVCQEASCPNIGECFSARTATFIIMGDKCTRNCRFCDVSPGRPSPPDQDEPRRVAEAVRKLNLKFAVITSVTRDDLPHGGAGIFAETIRQIRELSSRCKIEILIPDLAGDTEALDKAIGARPEVLAHNLETIPDLYSKVRPQANYQRSLGVLKYVSENTNDIIVKSGIMVGLGESYNQIEKVLADSAGVGCQIFTVGQYLAPSKKHQPIQKYYTPDEFDRIKSLGEKLGIKHMVSGPLVRSSYMAHDQEAKYHRKSSHVTNQ
ncbi:MAG: lipoyl synthase [candidate division Zixibacteria bacterium]|nr:lipoyl synthase [candidate division Zixibacteria bacterium]